MADPNVPYTIDFLQKIIQEHDDHVISYKLQREEKMTTKYHEHSAVCKKTHGTLEKYVRKEILNDFKSDYVLTDNNFPYYLEEGLGHKLLWTCKKMERESIEEIAKATFTGEFVWFENATVNKSLPGIYHYHIVFRIKKDVE